MAVHIDSFSLVCFCATTAVITQCVDSCRSATVNYVAQSLWQAVGPTSMLTRCIDSFCCIFASDRPASVKQFPNAYRLPCQWLPLPNSFLCTKIKTISFAFLLLTWLTWKFDWQILHKSAVNTAATAAILVSFFARPSHLNWVFCSAWQLLYHLATLALSLQFPKCFWSCCCQLDKIQLPCV